MAKILITEKQYKTIKERITEEINPNEAFDDLDALKTVISGKRNMCFLAKAGNSKYDNLIKMAEDAGLKIVSTPQDSGNSIATIVYRKGAEDSASQLLKIAKRNDGYLPTKSPEETYITGILLGYNKQAVRYFVAQKFPDFQFH